VGEKVQWTFARKPSLESYAFIDEVSGEMIQRIVARRLSSPNLFD
jgi:hypothetical protein